MLVNDKHLTTIWYDQAKEVVKIIDQRLLPFELKIVELKTLEDFCFAIKEMQVRGAPLTCISLIAKQKSSSVLNSTIFNSNGSSL